MIARRILVTGVVQGVGFRAFTQDAARRHGVSGWVRNLSDGRVEAWLEGDPEAVEGAQAALRAGPSASRVDELSADERAARGFEGFEVRSSGTAPA